MIYLGFYTEEFLITLVKFGLNAIELGDFGTVGNPYLLYGASIGIPLVAGLLTLFNGLAAPAYVTKNKKRLLWLYLIFSILSYVSMGILASGLLFDPEFTLLQEELTKVCVGAGILVVIAVCRTLLEYFLCKMRAHSRNRATQVTCRVGGIIAKTAGWVLSSACVAIAALFVYIVIAQL